MAEQTGKNIVREFRVTDVLGAPLPGILADLSATAFINTTNGSTVTSTAVSGSNIVLGEIGGGDYNILFKAAAFTVQGLLSYTILCSNLSSSAQSFSDSEDIGQDWVQTLDTVVSTLPALVWAYTTRTITSVTALAAQIAAAVWNAVATSYNVVGSMGHLLNTAGTAADPLLNLVPGTYMIGTAGYNLGLIAIPGTLTVIGPVVGDQVTFRKAFDFTQQVGAQIVIPLGYIPSPTPDGNVVTWTGAGVTVDGTINPLDGTCYFDFVVAKINAMKAGTHTFTIGGKVTVSTVVEVRDLLEGSVIVEKAVS